MTEFKTHRDMEGTDIGIEIINPSNETRSQEEQLDAIKAVKGPEHERRVQTLVEQLDAMFKENTEARKDDVILSSNDASGRHSYSRSVDLRLNSKTGEYLSRADREQGAEGTSVSITYGIDFATREAYNIRSLDIGDDLSPEAKSVLVHAIEKWVESKS
jgi:hypothetical protein